MARQRAGAPSLIPQRPSPPELHADLGVALVERLARLEKEWHAVPPRVVDCGVWVEGGGRRGGR